MKSQRAKNAVRKLLMSIFFLECIGMTSVYSQVHEAIKPHVDCKHSIFRHDNFIGCFSADKIAENGAYPPNQNGLIHPQLSLKWA